MTQKKQFEYEKGPRPDENRPTVDGSDESGSPDEPDMPDPLDESSGGRGRSVVVAGLAFGAAAFAGVFALMYQLAAMMDVMGAFSVEEGPSRTVIAGLTNLASHGATIEVDGEPIEAGIAVTPMSGLSSHVSALIPPVVLFAAGYLLVRHVRLETRQEGALAVGSLVASYAVLTVGLATRSRWAPEGGIDDQTETIAVATDFLTVLTVTRTALVFAVLGAGIAALPRVLEAVPIESSGNPD